MSDATKDSYILEKYTDWDEAFRRGGDRIKATDQFSNLGPDDLEELKGRFLDEHDNVIEANEPTGRVILAAKHAEAVIEAWLLDSNANYREARRNESELTNRAIARQQSARSFKEEILVQKSVEAVERATIPKSTTQRARLRRSANARPLSREMEYQYQMMLEDLQRLRQSVADVATNRKRIELMSLQSPSRVP